MIKRIKVEFTRTLHLPRFSVKEKETWEVRVDRLKKNGFSLSGGFISNDEFKVIHD